MRTIEQNQASEELRNTVTRLRGDLACERDYIKQLEARNSKLLKTLIGLCDLTCTEDIPLWLRNASSAAYAIAMSQEAALDELVKIAQENDMGYSK